MNHLPVLIGVSRITEKTKNASITPSTFFAKAVQAAVKDLGSTKAITGDIISDVVMVRTAVEDVFRTGTPLVPYKNLPQQVVKLAGLDGDGQRYYHTSSGGNTPQMLVNTFAERIAKGESKCVVIAGGELLKAFQDSVAKNRAPPEWGASFEENQVTRPVDGVIGKVKGDVDGCNDVERKNKITAPRQVYPLLEQAHRADKARGVKEHVDSMGKLFTKLNEVAASSEQKDLSWFPQRRTAQDISTEGPNNRWIAFPYTKYMNAVMQVNQASCVILASNKVADELGIPKEKRVYLRSCADAIEPGYYYSLRPNLGTSHAMVECLDTALNRANCRPQDINVFDLYSCFPIAVEVACDYLGIDPATDSRPLTVTGGLPYYGGPGNSYVICSIAAMVEQLRKRPVHELGLVTANGWFLTKHSCGIYSRTPPPTFEREDTKLTQARADKRAGKLVTVIDNPEGEGVVEAYIVDFSAKKEKPRVAAVGRMISGTEKGKRFIASTKTNDESYTKWIERDGVGMKVRVSTSKENGRGELQVEDASAWERQPLSNVPLPSTGSKL